jgi:hypothetical protein
MKYNVKELSARDVVHELRCGEVNVALCIGRALVRHAVRTAPRRLRYGTRSILLRAAGRQVDSWISAKELFAERTRESIPQERGPSIR